MEKLVTISFGDYNTHSRNNKQLRERALRKYFKKTDLDLGDNTKTDYVYEKLSPELVKQLKKSKSKKTKKELLILASWLIVVPIFIPPYAPELNPAERVWQNHKDNVCHRVFKTLDDMQDKMHDAIRKLLTSERVKSLTGYQLCIEKV